MILSHSSSAPTKTEELDHPIPLDIMVRSSLCASMNSFAPAAIRSIAYAIYFGCLPYHTMLTTSISYAERINKSKSEISWPQPIWPLLFRDISLLYTVKADIT